jgi:hypothetical protein
VLPWGILCVSDMPGASAPRVTHVLTEIDETLPTDDRLRAATYSAPGDMKAAGYIVAHVASQPAGRLENRHQYLGRGGVAESGLALARGSARRRAERPRRLLVANT